MEDAQASLRKLTGRAFQPAGTARSTAQRPEIAIAVGLCEQFGEAEAQRVSGTRREMRLEVQGGPRAGQEAGLCSACVGSAPEGG